MATIKPVSFNRLPEIDENDGKVILHDGSQLGRSTKELGEIIDDRLRTGLEDGKQYAMTTSGWKDVVIPEVDLTPYAYSAGLEADKQFVMTDNGWAEVDLSPYALSADVDSKAEEISSWANETFLTGVDLSDYALSADVDSRLDDTSAWANETFLTGVDLSDYALSADVDARLETKADAIARVGGGGPLFGENMKFRFAPEGGTNLNLQEYDSSIDDWTDIGVIVTKENKGPNKILKTNNINVLQWIDPDYYTKSETSAAIEISAALNDKEDKVFVAEYNVTTYADIKAAYDAGKQIFLLAQNFNEYAPEGWSPYTFKVPLTDFYSLGDDTWFKFSFFNDSAIVRKITVVIKNNNVWSVYYNTLQDELSAGTDLKIENDIIGVNTIGVVSGDFAFIEGLNTSALNTAAHAEGNYTVSKSLATHAEGYQTSAINYASHSEGANTLSNGYASHVEGNAASAIGYATHAEGNKTFADNQATHAEGQETSATYTAAHAEGASALASSLASHAEGANTISTSYATHAEGSYTSATNFATHTEGVSALADNYASHAEGISTIARGYGSHAEGYCSSAFGKYAHTEGEWTYAPGDYSHAEGYYTIAGDDYMHAGGKFNYTSSNVAFVIGNGSAANARSDAFIVDWNGNASATGDMYTSAGQVVTDVMLTSAANSSASFVTNGIADLTSLYTYIKSLEDRIAALEAAQGGFTVNGIQPTVNGNTITVGE